MTLFLLSSTMAFGALLLIHGLLKHGAATWPRLPAGLAAMATATIAASSIALHLGVRNVLLARPQRLLRWLCAALLLGGGFLVVEVILWTALWRGGLVIGNPPGGTFYAITGFHGLHVTVALGLLVSLVPGALHSRYHANDHVRVRLIARFWHFLGIHWLLIFGALFLA